MSRILAITPTYNEILNIGDLIDSIFSLDINIDVLVVDDSSPDGTADYIKSHPYYNKQLFLISRPSKLGLGSAYCRGYQWALDSNYSKLIQIDADLSHNPNEISRNINFFIKNKTDLLISSRYLKESKIINWSLERKLLSRISNILAKFFLNVPVSDYTNGFRIYNKKSAKLILKKCGRIGEGFII